MAVKKIASIACLAALAACSGINEQGHFVPTGKPTNSIDYYGHVFDIVPTFGQTDHIVVRGTNRYLDTQLHNVKVVTSRVCGDEDIVVIEGKKYSGDYMPTQEIVSIHPHNIGVALIPSGGGTPPFRFEFNNDGLEIFPTGGQGMFYRNGSFHALTQYQQVAARQQAAMQRQAAREARYAATHPAAGGPTFSDDVPRLRSASTGINDYKNQSIDLQD